MNQVSYSYLELLEFAVAGEYAILDDVVNRGSLETRRLLAKITARMKNCGAEFRIWEFGGELFHTLQEQGILSWEEHAKYDNPNFDAELKKEFEEVFYWEEEFKNKVLSGELNEEDKEFLLKKVNKVGPFGKITSELEFSDALRMVQNVARKTSSRKI